MLTGSLSLTTVIISTFIGLRIASKYFEHKRKELLLVGFTWVLLCEIWWSSAFSFLAALFTGEGYTPNPKIYFLLGNLLIPIALFMWLTAFTNFLYKEKKKIILLIAAASGLIYYVAFFYFIFTDVSVIGTLIGNGVDAEYKSFALFYLISVLLVFFITGILFARVSMRSNDAEIKLKGKFILLAVVFFTIGAALDGLKPFLFDEVLNAILIINRIILFLSSLAFYSGFLLPHFIKSLILKEK